MSSEIVGPLERVPQREESERRSGRELAIESLGPLTILGGHRVGDPAALPHRLPRTLPARGFYDYLIQGPVLVVGVGLFFALVIAPGLIEDLRSGRGTES